MWIKYNPNPSGRSVGDCSIRAVAKALNVSWETAYALVTANGYIMADMPSSNSVWISVLRKNGFERATIPNECPDRYTAEDFLRDHPSGIFVLGFDGHVATAIDGNLYDSWDSSQEIPIFVLYKRKE